MGVLAHVREKVIKAPEHGPRIWWRCMGMPTFVRRNMDIFSFEFLSLMKYKNIMS